MRLCHRRHGAVANVVNQLLSIRPLDLTAIEIVNTLLVNEEQVISARASLDVNVFSQLDVAVRAENGEAAIAPDALALRRVPIHADVACAMLTSQQHIAEISEFGMLRMFEVADL